MTTIMFDLVKIGSARLDELHAWLDDNSPGWKAHIPQKQSNVSFTVPEGDEYTLKNIRFFVETEESMITIGASRLGGKPLRIHYKVKDRNVAMMAKLAWGNVRLVRKSKSMVDG